MEKRITEKQYLKAIETIQKYKHQNVITVRHFIYLEAENKNISVRLFNILNPVTEMFLTDLTVDVFLKLRCVGKKSLDEFIELRKRYITI